MVISRIKGHFSSLRSHIKWTESTGRYDLRREQDLLRDKVFGKNKVFGEKKVSGYNLRSERCLRRDAISGVDRVSRENKVSRYKKVSGWIHWVNEVSAETRSSEDRFSEKQDLQEVRSP
ncbi:hypothetical protein Nepgr_001125 [Nepenthes gracilis]|uniref:Uncharacterized protein n=1 Tax=Nepenthes gracilis TaxID=150966 RepID=A0AAD3RX46_NEPGR|nr:hypothetical protein Nepgr_001125 [Nepenthes gracilis]